MYNGELLMYRSELMNNLDKLHTTDLSIVRIKKSFNIDDSSMLHHIIFILGAIYYNFRELVNL